MIKIDQTMKENIENVPSFSSTPFPSLASSLGKGDLGLVLFTVWFVSDAA